MYALKQLKKDMEFNRELFDIIGVFKDIASSEFRQLQSRRKSSIDFFECLKDLFQVVDWSKCKDFPLLRRNPSLPSAIVVVTSDEGFSGGLNTTVINTALSKRNRKDDEFIVLGEKGARLMVGMGEVFLYLEGVGLHIEYKQVTKISNFLLEQYQEQKWANVFVSYSRFISISQQQVEWFQLLPFNPQSILNLPFADEGLQPPVSLPQQLSPELLIEPNLKDVVHYLVWVWATSMLYEIFWESKLSEWAARLMHLEGSHQNLSQWYNELRFRYFRNLHEARDRNIREIFASRLE